MILKNKYLIGDFLIRIKRPVTLIPDNDYKLVTIKMNHNGVVLRGLKKGADIKSNMFMVKKGDFILSGIDARNGAFGIVPTELDGAIVTNDFWYFEIDKTIIDKQLFLELTSTSWFDDICNRGSDGMTQRVRLQKTKFFNQEIRLPLPNAQKELLTKIHQIKTDQTLLLNNTIEQLKQVSQLKQALLQEAIQGRLTDYWRVKNLDVESSGVLLKRIKAKKKELIDQNKIRKEKSLLPINEKEIPFKLPKGWTWCRLGDLCSKTGSGSTPRGGKKAYTNQGIKFIRSQNVYDDGLILSNIAYIPKTIHKKMNGTKVQSEDLLLNITGGSIGRCCIVNKDFDEGNINQHVAIIRPIFSKITYFLHNVICSPYFQNRIVDVQTGAGREGLPKNKMDNILIPLPSEHEQQIINQTAESLIQKCTKLETEIKHVENRAKKLMPAVINEAFH